MAASPAHTDNRSLSFAEDVPRDDDLRTVSGYNTDASSIWSDVPPEPGEYSKLSRYTGDGIRKGPVTTGSADRRAREALEKEAERIRLRMILGAGPDGKFSDCPPPTGKIRNQIMSRKTVEEAIIDCGDDEALKKAVIAATECEEYKAGKAVPAELLSQLSEVSGVRSQSRCRFPGCGKVSVRTDRAKEHARVHIGNHPFKCTKIQADESIGCGATFLRKHDRNRHNNGGDILKCEECGATIQGKGREHNLQRHKSNYCPIRKAAKQAEQASMATSSSNPSSAGSGSSAAAAEGTPTSGNGATPNAMHVEPALAELHIPAAMQVHGPVPASTALPMGSISMSMDVATGVEV